MIESIVVSDLDATLANNGPVCFEYESNHLKYRHFYCHLHRVLLCENQTSNRVDRRHIEQRYL
jgi:hypothetical protein